MVVKNLEFFDKDGYNLNLNWNEQKQIWEGNIFFPRVSVGLYENTTIYVIEYNEMLLREVILKEMSRKGQAFILYNNVTNMENLVNKYKKLIRLLKALSTRQITHKVQSE